MTSLKKQFGFVHLTSERCFQAADRIASLEKYNYSGIKFTCHAVENIDDKAYSVADHRARDEYFKLLKDMGVTKLSHQSITNNMFGTTSLVKQQAIRFMFLDFLGHALKD